MIRAALILCALATPAAAAPQCAPRAFVLDQLSGRYGEARQGAGLAENGALIEIFAAEGGSWSFTVTTPDGNMCLVASGQSWERHDDPPAPMGTPG